MSAASSESPDAQLLRRAGEGEERAFVVLVERYQQRFYGVALRVLGNERDAEDAVQLAFLRVFRSAGSYEPTGSAQAWMYRLLTNVCLDLWRKRKREGVAAGGGGSKESEEVAADPAIALRLDVRSALEQLSPEARAVVVLRFSEDLSYTEIASIRGVSVNTIKTQLARARRRLRECLKGTTE